MKGKTKHVKTLEMLFGNIREPELKINPEKYQLKKYQVKYLKHIIDKDNIKTDPSKIKAEKRNKG